MAFYRKYLLPQLWETRYLNSWQGIAMTLDLPPLSPEGVQSSVSSFLTLAPLAAPSSTKPAVPVVTLDICRALGVPTGQLVAAAQAGRAAFHSEQRGLSVFLNDASPFRGGARAPFVPEGLN